MVFFDWESLDRSRTAPTPTQQRNPILGVANQLRTALCQYSRLIPDSLYGGFVDNAVRDFNRATRNLICPNEPGQPETNAFTGGQCAGVLYEVVRRERYFRNSTQTFRTADASTQLVGAIGRPFKVTQGVFTGYNIPTGNGVVGFTTFSNNQADEQIFDVSILSITPVGAVSDNCGNLQNDRPNPGGQQNTFNFDFTVGGVTLNIPIIISGIRVDGSIDVVANFNANLQFTANFNLGGVDVNVNFPGGNPPSGTGGDGVDIQPILDAISGVGNQVQEVKEVTDNTFDLIDEFTSKVGNFKPIPILNPDDLCDSTTQLPETLFDAFTILAANSNRYYQKDCLDVSTSVVFVGNYLSSIAQRSFYVNMPPNTVAVLLELSEPLPPKVGYTLSNEVSGSFGALSLCQGTRDHIGETSQVYTRFTSLVDPTGSVIRRVRVFLKADINFTISALVKGGN